MADADMSGGLLGADEVPVLTPEQQVAAVLGRDARRVRQLTWLAAAFWLLTLLTVAGMLWMFDESVMPKAGKLLRDTPGASGRPGDPPPRPDASVEERTVGPLVTYVYVLTYGLVILTAAVGVLALAAVTTLVLVHLTRRATLRQIRVSLQSIAEQLRQMQAARPEGVEDRSAAPPGPKAQR
jgi:hypothetical protein